MQSSGPRSWARGSAVIAAAACALVLPVRAEAHGRANVIALDYQARLPAGEVAAPGVRARVLDGDRKLELSVDPSTTVVVMGYAGERFLRFTAAGVEVNERSPTAVADKLVSDAAPVLEAGARPKWKLVRRGHRLAWHDHRLGARATSGRGTGRVGTWAIPIVVDGSPETIAGGLWRAPKPALWPWLLLWLGALAATVLVAHRVARSAQRRAVAVAAAACAGLVLLCAAGFASSSARSGVTRWLDLAFPAQFALAGVAVFFLRERYRLAAASFVAGFAFALALEDVPVFVHGFVVSALPGALVRALLALALAAGGFALVLAVVELWRAAPPDSLRSAPRPRPQMAIPRGRTR